MAEQLATQLKEVHAKMSVINKRVRQIKKDEGYDLLKAEADELKDKLYQYMSDNDVQQVSTFKLASVMPTDEKKELRSQIKQQKVLGMLQRALPLSTEALDPLAEEIAQI